MPQRYLDDFRLGEVFKSAPHTLSDKHFTGFAELTGDAHPLHYDADYARGKGWDAPIAHGLLLLGLCALGAAPIHAELTDSMIAMLGNEARYKRPAFMGDTVTPQFTVVSIEPKGDDRGIVRLAIALYNQRNEVVLEGAHVLMLKRRGKMRRDERPVMPAHSRSQNDVAELVIGPATSGRTRWLANGGHPRLCSPRQKSGWPEQVRP